MLIIFISLEFVKIIPKKRGGIQKEGVGNHIFTITNVEKTFVDCFDLPQYSGGYPELIRAFNEAVLNPQKLIEKTEEKKTKKFFEEAYLTLMILYCLNLFLFLCNITQV